MGIYDVINGGLDPNAPFPVPAEEDYDLELDLRAGMTVSGDFDDNGGGDSSLVGPRTYVFEEVSGAGGSLSASSSDGTWTFTSDGTAEFGDTFVFTVTSTILLENPGDPDDPIVLGDSDSVTITFTCFAEGTLIDMPECARAVEDLAPGELVQTRDRGAQPVRWIGSRRIDQPGDFGAVVIGKGALGNAAELRVSPSHRILVTGWRAEALTGDGEVLVAARDLINGDTIWQDRETSVTYYHMLFDTHEIVRSHGVESESYHPTTTGLADLDPAARDEVLAIFPELADLPASYGPAARPTLTSTQAKILLS